MGIVAGHTGQFKIIPRISDLAADGMGKFPLVFMTAGTDFDTAPL